MKIQRAIRFLNHDHRLGRWQRHERGSIALVFVILMAIMMILIMAESRALIQLHGEVKYLERQQTKRLNPAAATNHFTQP
jgi:hypothetical protein